MNEVQFDKLRQLAAVDDREGMLDFILSIMGDFSRREDTEWAFWRTNSFLADGWQSAQGYCSLQPQFEGMEIDLGIIVNRLIRGYRADEAEARVTGAPWLHAPDELAGVAAAFVFYVTTVEPERVSS